jgi:hypothetical protein
LKFTFKLLGSYHEEINYKLGLKIAASEQQGIEVDLDIIRVFKRLDYLNPGDKFADLHR